MAPNFDTELAKLTADPRWAGVPAERKAAAIQVLQDKYPAKLIEPHVSETTVAPPPTIPQKIHTGTVKAGKKIGGILGETGADIGGAITSAITPDTWTGLGMVGGAVAAPFMIPEAAASGTLGLALRTAIPALAAGVAAKTSGETDFTAGAFSGAIGGLLGELPAPIIAKLSGLSAARRGTVRGELPQQLLADVAGYLEKTLGMTRTEAERLAMSIGTGMKDIGRDLPDVSKESFLFRTGYVQGRGHPALTPADEATYIKSYMEAGHDAKGAEDYVLGWRAGNKLYDPSNPQKSLNAAYQQPLPTSGMEIGRQAGTAAKGRMFEDVGGRIGNLYKPTEENAISPVELNKIAIKALEVQKKHRFARGQFQREATRVEQIGTAGTESHMAKVAGPPTETVPLPSGDIAQYYSQILAKMRSEAEPVTVNQLRELQRDMTDSALNQEYGTSRHIILKELLPTIEETLQNYVAPADRPLLAKLNADYRDLKTLFPSNKVPDMDIVSTFAELGQELRRYKPVAFNEVWSRSTPAEQGLMRRGILSNLLQGQPDTKTFAIRLRDNDSYIATMYAGTPLGDKGVFPQLVHFAETFEKGPESQKAAEAWMRGIRDYADSLPAEQKAMLEKTTNEFRSKASLTSPAAMQEFQAAASGKGQRFKQYASRHFFEWGPISAMMGYGIYTHNPALAVTAAALLGIRNGLGQAMRNPALAKLYLRAISNGFTRTGGYIAGKYIMAGLMSNTEEAMGIGAQPVIGPTKPSEMSVEVPLPPNTSGVAGTSPSESP